MVGVDLYLQLLLQTNPTTHGPGSQLQLKDQRHDTRFPFRVTGTRVKFRLGRDGAGRDGRETQLMHRCIDV
jgi:hypothetical protein